MTTVYFEALWPEPTTANSVTVEIATAIRDFLIP
jgi:hypothetical protein